MTAFGVLRKLGWWLGTKVGLWGLLWIRGYLCVRTWELFAMWVTLAEAILERRQVTSAMLQVVCASYNTRPRGARVGTIGDPSPHTPSMFCCACTLLWLEACGSHYPRGRPIGGLPCAHEWVDHWWVFCALL